MPADLPVAAPDHAQIVRRVLGPRKRASDAVREAHFALDALLAERQQDKEALRTARPYVYGALAQARAENQPWRVTTAEESLAQVDAALAVEEDAPE